MTKAVTDVTKVGRLVIRCFKCGTYRRRQVAQWCRSGTFCQCGLIASVGEREFDPRKDRTTFTSNKYMGPTWYPVSGCLLVRSTPTPSTPVCSPALLGTGLCTILSEVKSKQFHRNDYRWINLPLSVTVSSKQQMNISHQSPYIRTFCLMSSDAVGSTLGTSCSTILTWI